MGHSEGEKFQDAILVVTPGTAAGGIGMGFCYWLQT
jgi:hypothetical protein